MDKYHGSLIVAVFSILSSIFIFRESVQMPDFGKTYSSPATMPLFIALVMAAAGVAVLLETLRTSPRREPGTPLFAWPRLSDPGFRNFLVIVPFTVLYVILVPRLHFTLTSILFLAVVFCLYRIGSPIKIAAITLGSVFIIQQVFTKVFRTILP